MDDINKILEELESLPKGYISKKKIHGKVYHYLQRREDGRVKSTYIKEQDLEETMRALDRRKELEAMLGQSDDGAAKASGGGEAPKKPRRRKAAIEPEPVRTPEPAVEPEPVSQPEPASPLESASEPEPVSNPKPASQPESISKSEPASEPEPVKEPEKAEKPMPVQEPVTAAKPQEAKPEAPVHIPEVTKVIEPAERPEIGKIRRELTGCIMLDDKEVAAFESGKCISVDEQLCPFIIRRTRDLVRFLSSRAIDGTRPNAIALKHKLGLGGEPDYVVSLFSYGAAITDDYWFKPKGSRLNYSDVKFNKDHYADFALNGSDADIPAQPMVNPQLTVTGSHEKCWKLVDNEWWLYKKETEDEAFSEIMSGKIGSFMGIPSAPYMYDGQYVRTRNFSVGYTYEPMSALAGDDNSFANVLDKLNGAPSFVKQQYLRLLAFSAIVGNKGLSNNDFGVLRDKNSGKILRLAPIFGNNKALIGQSRELESKPELSAQVIGFVRFVLENQDAKKLCAAMAFPQLTEEDIKTCMLATPIKRPENNIIGYVYRRYAYIKDALKIR